MNDRENVISLFRRTGYERMPIDFGMTPIVKKNFDDFIEKTGYTYPESPFANLPGPRLISSKGREYWQEYWLNNYNKKFNVGTNFNAYGVANEPGSAACLHMTRRYHPLEKAETLEEFKAYPFPEFSDEPSEEMLTAVKEAHEKGKFAMGNMQSTIWEASWGIRSMEALMMDMLSQPELADFLLEKLTTDAIARARAFIKAGADGIYIGDDIGMQSTIMMDIETYRRFLKPRLTKLIAEARKINPDIIIIYHSCGYVEPFIEDLIEAGIDVLNPVQSECMDFKEIYNKYGNRLSFSGTIGTQTTMPFGKPEDIKKEIKDRLDFVGEKGGLLICPTHVLEPEVPIENVVAYIEGCNARR